MIMTYDILWLHSQKTSSTHVPHFQGVPMDYTFSSRSADRTCGIIEPFDAPSRKCCCRLSSMSMWGFKLWKCKLAGACLFSNMCTLLIFLAAPDIGRKRTTSNHQWNAWGWTCHSDICGVHVVLVVNVNTCRCRESLQGVMQLATGMWEQWEHSIKQTIVTHHHYHLHHHHQHHPPPHTHPHPHHHAEMAIHPPLRSKVLQEAGNARGTFQVCNVGLGRSQYHAGSSPGTITR